jgi:nucleotide-binding universal stress UspA family protein
MTTEPSRLVFGDDGSDGADTAWSWIVRHPWTGWEAQVITATGRTPVVGEAPVERDRFDGPPRVAPPSCGFASIRHLEVDTDPRLALDRPADLLVIGPRGGGIWKALHLGSTADWLAHHPPAPLLIARTDREARSVLVCTDGSAHAMAAVRAFDALPLADQAVTTVFSVDDGRHDPEAAVVGARGVLDGRAADLRTRIVAGIPTNEILHAVVDLEPDLVVLGTRGLTGLLRLRLGSTAGAVARMAAVPVLLASAPDRG